ncbi:MAG: septal ring lytic transglycosylase RlpA family protein [Prevotella sp.]|nr:septal ring lytic transglycosylase RlpA family protein [Prevotella sp.]
MNMNRLLPTAFFSLITFITLSAQSSSSGGKASYYSNGLHGRRMSNGERYDRNGYTCAHRTLPFGTRLRVTNPRNGKSVIVRVTDRGPFVRGRIVDLSYAAARELGTISSGVAYVKVEVVSRETEIPFAAEPTVIEIPEIEYGTAGVCYEFIPEWEKVEEEKPKEIERKVDTRLNSRRTASQSRPAKEINEAHRTPRTKAATTVHSTHTAHVSNSHQPGSTQSAQQRKESLLRATQKSETAPAPSPKKETSSSWTNFFKRIKDGVTGLFE